jgi:hypothetical protein
MNANTFNFTKIENILANETSRNFMKYFFTYDYMKFQQLLNVTNNKFIIKKSQTLKTKNKLNSTIRKRFQRTKIRKNTKEDSDNLFSDFHTSKNFNFYQSTESNNKLIEEIREIKNIQKETDNKLNNIIKIIKKEKENFQIESSHFEFKSTKEESHNYFSFKINTDLELNDGKNTIILPGGKRIKCASPDRLISHRFFEDSENFRNTNLISVKNYNNDNNENNPFCLTAKSIPLINNVSNNIFSSDHKPDEDNYTDNIDLDTINNFTSKDFNTNIEVSKLIKTENYNLSNSEREINKTKNIPSEEEATFKPSVTEANEINDSISMSSNKNINDSSQDKLKKVRGFNFKNNINTKKFSKPLISSQITQAESLGNIIHVNKSCNFEEKGKFKKLLSNNINLKKILNEQSNNFEVKEESAENK